MSVFKDAILNGLGDRRYRGHQLLTPTMLTNNGQERIWLALRRELLTCRHFTWAVAFITADMLVPLKVVLADLAAKGIHGTLYTGDYLGFNSPRVFKELRKIPNLTVKIVQEQGFHAKGYLFDHGKYQTAIIGSANFTRAALLKNQEWALRVSSRQNATLTDQLKFQLSQLAQASRPLDQEWLTTYQQGWQPPSHRFDQSTKKAIVPNKMQAAALKELRGLVDSGARKGLVVSATGTGKTYLGALAVKEFHPRRFLYVVHREQVARKSLASFRRVIGGPASDYGMMTGNQHDWDAKYLFATVQTLSQPHVLAKLDPTLFDYLLIDEVHRVGAPSYHRVLDHFTPRFCLGMTATPERMDHQDVYAAFDYHLAYEIRLKDALEADMLTPFHYVGVRDYELAGQKIDETTSLRRLVADERVHYILKELDYYGFCGDQARGLIFCSRQKEAYELAVKFNQAGHPAIALTNQSSPIQRREAVTKLEAGEIEYIITVDLFNEGVDIPSLNQIVMLRNTQSSIVFTQQLGRGLRKYPGKDYLTVLDFIGNYKNNYLIPLALNQDNSRDQDRARAEVRLPGIVGVSTINFDRVASQEILDSLAKVKLDAMHELRRSYQELKDKLGRVPYLADFQRFGSTSPLVFAANNRLTHYGSFLQKVGVPQKLTAYEGATLSFVTKELLNGKRPHELVLLQGLLHHDHYSLTAFQNDLARVGAYDNPAVLQSVDNVLSLSFFDVKAGKKTKKAQYGGVPLVEHADLVTYRFNPQLAAALANHPDFYRLFTDAVKTGLSLSKNYAPARQLTRYRRYDRKDVCRLLNWPRDVSAPMYGYRVGDHECPIFITYHKGDGGKRNAIYDNRLENGQALRWYTRSPRHLVSPEVQRLLACDRAGQPLVKIHLFVKDSDAVGKEFFYLGTAKIDRNSIAEEKIGPKKKAVVGMDLVLDSPLPPRIGALIFDAE